MSRRPRIDKFGNVRSPWAAVPGRLVIAMAGLLVLSFVARRELGTFVSAVEHYAPPGMSDIAMSSGSSPVADRAVIVIVSGLRLDVADDMPALQSLSQRGVSARVQLPWPTTKQSTWTTLLSGSEPELAGTIAFTTAEDLPRPVGVDNLLRRARVTRHAIGLTGQTRWITMLPDAAGGQTFVTDTADDDPRVVRAALDMLANDPPDLLLVQLAHLDTVGGRYGGSSDEYYRAALRTDEQLARLLASIDLQDTVVVITSDHGHLDGGGYGGLEPAVARVPLVLAGPGVGVGSVGAVDQRDIAPTIAALTGLPIPAASTGAPQFDMLALTPPLEAEKAIALAEQQINLAAAYRHARDAGASPVNPAETLRVAKSARDINNIPATLELARESEQDARRDMASVRQAQIATERSGRLPAVLGLLALTALVTSVLLDRQRLWLAGVAGLSWLGPLGGAHRLAALADSTLWHWSPTLVGAALGLTTGVWARRSRQSTLWIVALVALAVGLVSTAIGADVSPRTIASLAAWRNAMLGPLLLAFLLGGGAVIITVNTSTHPVGGRRRMSARLSLWFVGELVAALGLELALSYSQFGRAPTWYLPRPELLYGRLATLLQIMLVSGLGVLLPLVVVLAVLALQRLRPDRPRVRAGAARDAHGAWL